MTLQSNKVLKAALAALHYTQADDLLAHFTGGSGVIFTLHHVTPEASRGFEPNAILKATPEFLDSVIRQVRGQGYEIIAIDAVAERLTAPRAAKPFAVFTLDDGYRDNRDFAYPVFKAHGAPFTVYVPTDYPDGRGELWWLTLEEALRRLDHVTIDFNGKSRKLALGADAEKRVAFEAIYWMIRALPEADGRALTRRLAAEARFNPLDLTRDLVMTWDELRAFAADPLVTIGAHTKSHHALAKLSDGAARDEIAGSIARIERELGRPCRHFSYPYGDEGSAGTREFAIARELGLDTAVTTCKGLIHAGHRDALTALPRLSLNGEFQDSRYVKVLLSGAPFAMLEAMRKVAKFKRRTFAST